MPSTSNSQATLSNTALVPSDLAVSYMVATAARGTESENLRGTEDR